MTSRTARTIGPRRTAFMAAGLVAAAAAVSTSGVATASPDPTPVPQLDLGRYLGIWHQLAAVPQVFNLACARDTVAEYHLDERGDVAVHNSCVTWNGGLNEIHGTATVNDRQTGAQLHVGFPAVPGQDQRYGPTNYIVTALGPDYSWALVTDPTRASGFVLSREVAFDPETWNHVRAAITAMGQSPCLYLTSPTTGGLSDIAPLCTR
ncbi:lipocalin family protein [Nocardia sp. CA-129566]|uniref:lipocalin family protein n=1 Tax=Nocardia sp. CA-129566 TaxID=3239976 RepID=UPI003D973FDF